MNPIRNIFKLTLILMTVCGICAVGSAEITASTGADAVKQLRESGEYESLQAAYADSVINPANQTPEQSALQNKLVGIGLPSKNFGQSVAVSGDTAIVGAPNSNFGPNVQQGLAFVFVKTDTGWQQQSVLSAPDGAALDNFGYSVAVGSDLVVVGAYNDDGSFSNQGSAYIFVRNGNNWTLQTKLVAADGAADDRFGFSVAANLSTVVIGADGDDSNVNTNQGSAYVYVRNGDVWSLQKKLLASDGAGGDFFGTSVSISFNTVIVGASRVEVNGTANQGAAYIFSRAGSDWMQSAKLAAGDGEANDNFGASVSINLNTAIVGSPSDDIGANSDQGSAYVFVKTGEVWAIQAKLFDMNGSQQDGFGNSVSISADTTVVGASQKNVGNTSDQGSTFVFKRKGTIWTKRIELFAADGKSFDQFGKGVAVSGGTAIVGAWLADFPNNTDQGAAYAFDVANRAPYDFDGDGRSDISVYRPSAGAWYLNRSTAGFTGVAFGITSDKIAPADFDGDGKTDIAVFRDGTWYHLKSSDGTFVAVGFGQAGDIPRPADFDGDGRADLNLFRPSNSVWYRLNSTDGSFSAIGFGQNGDKPLVADYDGDGRADVSVFRPTTSVFYSLNSSNGQLKSTAFGTSGDIPIAGDYDGDGKTDVAVFRPSNGAWYRLNSTDGSFAAVSFGQNGDIPVAADYDGDGKTDIAVVRNGTWYRLNSSDGAFAAEAFGFGTDSPVPAAFIEAAFANGLF